MQHIFIPLQILELMTIPPSCGRKVVAAELQSVMNLMPVPPVFAHATSKDERRATLARGVPNLEAEKLSFKSPRQSSKLSAKLTIIQCTAAT
jgi:hypothetical protein